MKKIINFSTAFLIGMVFASFTGVVKAQVSTNKSVTEQQATKKYTCPMHPEVVMDKPGKCPKCGMPLVEKTDGMKGDMNHMNNMNHMNHNMNQMNHMNDTSMKKSNHKMMMHDTTMMKKGKK